MNLEKTSKKTYRSILEIYLFFKKQKIGTAKLRIKALHHFLDYFAINNLKIRNSKIVITKSTHAKNINFLITLIHKLHNITYLEAENKMNKLLASYVCDYKNGINFSLNNLRKIEEAVYYIKYDRNQKNIEFKHKTLKNYFLITINLSKPEKIINKNIANNIKKSSSDPKCAICIENVGWSGSYNQSSRENLIIKNIKLHNENWFIQFSPYEYFKNHLIIINKEHTKMKFDINIIRRFYDFIKDHPNYFIGANAGIKYIGGSILNHNHYQAGFTKLPIMQAQTIEKIDYKKSSIAILNWPCATIKIKSQDINELTYIYWHLLQNWLKINLQNINNKKANNCFSLIFKKINKEFSLWITYRNNSTSKKRPLGTFHIHPKRQNIKQEAMGLIEISGLAIFPGRLKNEFAKIIKLWNHRNYTILQNNAQLKKHYYWLLTFAKKNENINWTKIKKYLGATFVMCIKDCDVFASKEIFQKFIRKEIKSLNYIS